jgi:hypothetical protein
VHDALAIETGDLFATADMTSNEALLAVNATVGLPRLVCGL